MHQTRKTINLKAPAGGAGAPARIVHLQERPI